MKVEITPALLKYLAHLVDFDTTGDQDDPLYLLLRQVVDACGEVENSDE